MTISGKIEKILPITDNINNVILVKQRRGKPYYISVLFYYHMKDVIVENYSKNDFVKIWFRVRSNPRTLPNGGEKYYTDLIGEKILLIKRNGEKVKPLYNTEGKLEKNHYIIETTGEVVMLHSLQNQISLNPARELKT